MKNNFNAIKVKICVGFASKDKKFKETFQNHLSPLNLDITWSNLSTPKNVNFNHNGDIRKKIKELSSSQIIVFLVSPNFLSLENFDKYVNVDLYENNRRKVVVIPIILDFCIWKNTPLKNFEPLPKNGTPVTDRTIWSNQNQAFHEITIAIDRRIEEIKIQEKERRETDQQKRMQLFQDKGVVPFVNRPESNLSKLLNNAHTYCRVLDSYKKHLSYGFFILLLIVTLTIFNLFAESKIDKAKQFPVTFLNHLNDRQCPTAWKMIANEYSIPDTEFMKNCSQIAKVEHKLSKVMFESDTKVKLYVEWQYCQDRNLYYASELWWLQWNVNDRQWFLDINKTQPNKGFPQRRADC